MVDKATKLRASKGAAGRPRRASPKVLKLIRESRQQAAIAGKCWDRAEAKVEELIKLLGAGRIVAVEDGVFFQIRDLFANVNALYVPKMMKRYKAVICDANGKEIRLRDRVAKGKGKATAGGTGKATAKRPTAKKSKSTRRREGAKAA